MYPPPIARNRELTRLADDGFALEVDPEGVLLVHHVPYVTSAREVKFGTMLVRVTTSGSVADIVGFPDHTVFFAGETPCDDRGVPLFKVINSSQHTQLSRGSPTTICSRAILVRPVMRRSMTRSGSTPRSWSRTRSAFNRGRLPGSGPGL